MPVTALQGTKILCQARDWTLTHLQIQKILYLCHMYKLLLSEGKEGLFRYEPFEAWNYGPVISEVYHAVKMFGADPVWDIFGNISLKNVDRETKVFIEAVGAPMGDITPGDLVGMTHRRGGAWDQCFRPGKKNIRIPDQLIYQEAKEIASLPDEVTLEATG